MSKPSLRDRVRAYPTKHGPKCSVCKLPPKVLAEINEILREDGACHAALSTALREDGIVISRQRLGHHYQEGHHVAS